MDQEGKAGGKDDAAELPPVSVEQGAAVAERARIQLGQPVAAVGAAEGDRIVVAHQLAAAAGEDRRSVDRACSLLLAIAGGRTPHARAVRDDVAQDRAVAASGKLND